MSLGLETQIPGSLKPIQVLGGLETELRIHSIYDTLDDRVHWIHDTLQHYRKWLAAGGPLQGGPVDF